MIRIIVLSDRKPGHYNQSLGLIQRLSACDYEWIDVYFLSKGRDNLLRALMRVIGGFRLPRSFINTCLRMALQPETFNEIIALDKADLVLSTGSSMAALNLLIGQRLNARTVTCRRPSPLGIGYFDLAILPKTNWPRRNRKNVCKTLGVPNPIRPEQLDRRKKQLQAESGLSPDRRRIGVLVGGEDRYDTISEKTAAHFIETLKRIARGSNSQILLTTSRRTSTDVENLIGKQLSDSQLCPMCVLARQTDQPPNAVEKIFALSDLIIVTEDSFSMVCEAASSGRRVIILEVDHKTRRRHRRYKVYSELTQRNLATWARIADLEVAVQRIFLAKPPVQPLNDAEIGAAAIERLLKAAGQPAKVAA